MSRMAILALLICSLLAGCGGPKLVPVEGGVKFDGKPVEGATVTFISDDGKTTFAGTTDAAGRFTLQTGDKVGALPGNYKVTVVKSPNKPGAEAADPNTAGMKMMKKDFEEANKSAVKPGGSDPASKMKMGMGGGPKGAAVALPVEKTELPGIYSSGTTTPLTAKVPSDQPIEFDLSAKK